MTTKVDLGETLFAVRRTSNGLLINLRGPEGHAEISVSEPWVRSNLKVFDTIRRVARFIPGSRGFLTHATKLKKAIEDELVKPPQ